MTDIIFGTVLILILSAAAGYIYRAKKRGVKCIGCPAGETCCSAKAGAGCGHGCSCGCGSDSEA